MTTYLLEIEDTSLNSSSPISCLATETASLGLDTTGVTWGDAPSAVHIGTRHNELQITKTGDTCDALILERNGRKLQLRDKQSVTLLAHDMIHIGTHRFCIKNIYKSTSESLSKAAHHLSGYTAKNMMAVAAFLLLTLHAGVNPCQAQTADPGLDPVDACLDLEDEKAALSCCEALSNPEDRRECCMGLDDENAEKTCCASQKTLYPEVSCEAMPQRTTGVIVPSDSIPKKRVCEDISITQGEERLLCCMSLSDPEDIAFCCDYLKQFYPEFTCEVPTNLKRPTDPMPEKPTIY